MLKYAKIENQETKECSVGTGTDTAFYKSIDMEEMEVEKSYNGGWYIKGYAPQQPQVEIIQQEIDELKKYLLDTDYKVIKAMENRETIDEETKIKRQEARDRINELEVTLTDSNTDSKAVLTEAKTIGQESIVAENLIEEESHDEL